jgi:hypothetical protein
MTLGVGYHRWILATEEEYILLQGGGTDDGDLFIMQSYRLELGGATEGLAVLGTLSRCDNASAMLSKNMQLTDIFFI